ncbi:MAG: hypothetical protein JW934_02940 [Anaerolineae bacterium]|nr:hypothetical protein [Anaerolineae bacterium]
MNKRDLLLSLLDDTLQTTIPAAFFLHFDPTYHRGQAAVDKHLEYFRYTGMDWVKIQYEHAFPHRPDIQRPQDWAKMPLYGRDFYEEPLRVVEGLVKAAKKEALILTTLYSPFMCAGHTTSDQTITEHLRSDPEAVRRGMEIITDSIMIFVRECIRLGVDGFYASTQGGEGHRFADPATFERYIKPYDLAVMREIDRCCPFNILHICDYNGPYSDYGPFVDYAGDVVNCPLHLDGQTVSPQAMYEFFGRPYMGGLERKGIIATGSKDKIEQEVKAVLGQKPPRFVLGADCTVPGHTPWDNLKTAIDTAHAYSTTRKERL